MSTTLVNYPTLLDAYQTVRNRTIRLSQNLASEDYVAQPIADVSPTKWHLGHTSWFFETFILQPFHKNYKIFNESFGFVFNSYYESVGKRVIRTQRGNLTRPTTQEILQYRSYIDQEMESFLEGLAELSTSHQQEVHERVTLGLNHEQQHQELLITDIKYVLGHNPLFPAVEINHQDYTIHNLNNSERVTIQQGIYEIGFEGKSFHFDNEKGRHKVYLNDLEVQANLVNNEAYLEFIEAGGYDHFEHWLAEGWDWVQKNQIKAPLYWHDIEGKWYNYTFKGLQPVLPEAPVCHISYYEAEAFARWAGKRLLTEAEWEVASSQLNWGQRWEWTQSAYLPYPGFTKAPGAIGEYNGKFMINQMVLRGSSEATSPHHSRPTYRNFFHADKQWQFSGIRLVEKEYL